MHSTARKMSTSESDGRTDGRSVDKWSYEGITDCIDRAIEKERKKEKTFQQCHEVSFFFFFQTNDKSLFSNKARSYSDNNNSLTY